MIAIFTKPLDLVTDTDVRELETQAWPEGYEVEFKKTLPHKSGGRDPWMDGKDGVGDFARDEILAEVIAFANAHGGTVVLGIGETADKPARAKLIDPLPRVGELARRFEDQARSCIDPRLSRLQIRAIETTQDGGGVIVFRTGPSRSAPHRLTTNRRSFVRRGSSTVEMTMREIQDMTLDVARGAAGINTKFAARREAFVRWTQRNPRTIAFRVTAIPLEQLPDPGRIFSRRELFPYYPRFSARIDQRVITLEFQPPEWNERPVIRGIARWKDSDQGDFRYELYQSGLIDLWFSNHPRPVPGLGQTWEGALRMDHSELLAGVANVLVFCPRDTVTKSGDFFED